MRWLTTSRGGGIWSKEFELDLKPVWRIVREHPEAVVLGMGFLLRYWVYLINRGFWLDEGSLFGNLVGKGIFEFDRPLTQDQLAPIAFLVVQRAIVQVLGISRYAVRLVPLLCGVGALFLFARLARRVLPRRPALIALVLFAFSDDLVYYSSELKPYTIDLLVGLAISLGAFEALDNSATWVRAGSLALGLIAAPWCSFASTFVIAGCGTTLILDCLRWARYRDAASWSTVAIAWLASFVFAYRASRSLLGADTTMYLFWDFAFLPIVPFNLANLSKTAGHLLEVFVNPLNLVYPDWPRTSVVFPLALMVIGVWSLARRSGTYCLMLVLPIALAIVASAAKRYPFHGRLMLELVPALFILIAEGTEWLYQLDTSRSKLSYKAALALLLVYPCLATCYEATGPRIREFNTHGDLHKNIFIR